MSRVAVQPLPARGVRARVLAPFYYHSLAVPGGTATQAAFLTDRQVSFACAAALGCLSASPALPRRDYRSHLGALPFIASLFETDEPRLLPPVRKRLTLEDEGGYDAKLQGNVGTGNLKTFFAIQEVPPGIVYRGAVFGRDPFALASEAEGRKVERIVVRTGRHRGGLVELVPDEVGAVRLNAHTAGIFGGDADGMEVYVMHDLQATRTLSLPEAAASVGGWQHAGWGRG